MDAAIRIAPRGSASGLREQRPGQRAGRGDGRVRRHPDQGGARRDRAPARALPGSEGALHQCRRPVPHDPAERAPHGLSDRDFDSLFTVDKPIIFNFHGYPWLIHRLAYRRTNHRNLQRARLQGEGQHQHALELAIDNEIDRFSLAIDVINRVPRLQVAGAHAKEKFRDMQIDCRSYAHEHGVDQPEAADWTWPF